MEEDQPPREESSESGMEIPLVDLRKQYARLKDDILGRIEEILAKREGRKPRRRVVFKGPGREWNRQRCMRTYRSFREIPRNALPVPVRPWRPESPGG